MAAIERAIAEHGPRLAAIVWPGVQYRTGQAFDLKEIARLGHAAGAIVGFDLAHAVGNLPLQLHDSEADFAGVVPLQVHELRARARWAAASCTHAMRRLRGRASPVGGATTRTRASAWTDASCPRPAPMAGS
jgi:hypothetical protein